MFLGNRTLAEIKTAETGGLWPVFMSGSASAECVPVALQSRGCRLLFVFLLYPATKSV